MACAGTSHREGVENVGFEVSIEAPPRPRGCRYPLPTAEEVRRRTRTAEEGVPSAAPFADAGPAALPLPSNSGSSRIGEGGHDPQTTGIGRPAAELDLPPLADDP